MKSPQKRYIQSLLVIGETEAQILSKFQSFKFPITLDCIKDIKKTLLLKYPDYQDIKKTGYITKSDIRPMVHYLLNLPSSEDIKCIEGAFNLLADKQVMKIVTTLRLASVGMEEIELVLNAKYDLQYDSSDFEAFENYFFDVNKQTFSAADKLEYLSNLKEDDELRSVYKLALSDHNKDYIFWRLGLAPSGDYGEMLREMFQDCFYNFKERMKVDADCAQKWGSLAVRLADKLDQFDNEKEKDHKLFEETLLKVKEIEDNTISQETEIKFS